MGGRIEMEEEDSFVELVLRLAKNGRTKGQGCQCLASVCLAGALCLSIA